MAKSNRSPAITFFIFLALAAGILTGSLIYYRDPGHSSAVFTAIIYVFSLMPDIFLRMIKMIIAPLVLTTLTAGIGKQMNGKAAGRIGIRTLVWFLGGSFLSLALGMLLVNVLHPGSGLHLTDKISASLPIANQAMTLKDFLYHVFPTSIMDAMARNEILQVVVFSLFLGFAMSSLGEKAAPVVRAMDAFGHILLKATTYVMNFAPIAVFGAMAQITAGQGVGILFTYSRFIGAFYLGLILLLIILFAATAIVIKRKILRLLKHTREPALLAFATNSSEAAFPKLMVELERMLWPQVL
jgi:Na+/H+-dicarboxylate symporter